MLLFRRRFLPVPPSLWAIFWAAAFLASSALASAAATCACLMTAGSATWRWRLARICSTATLMGSPTGTAALASVLRAGAAAFPFTPDLRWRICCARAELARDLRFLRFFCCSRGIGALDRLGILAARSPRLWTRMRCSSRKVISTLLSGRSSVTKPTSKVGWETMSSSWYVSRIEYGRQLARS